ncbi:MAG: DUF2269 domain-containing protein [Colwellia sp.]|nr:DUF2269 domain-containing protein [Colwellia sp.]MCW8863703.1 DUF2269 domain-containing protein [Colwellia sp.]MCW9081342.1 DUF2269 domain-containing protein [Colwellia sp.]
MIYVYLKYFHILGAILLATGLIGVWLFDLRSRQQHEDLVRFGESIRNIRTFYYGLTTPGAIIMLITGVWLVIEFYGGPDFIDHPWLAGMIFLFLFEFIEGNTITRIYFDKIYKLSEASLEAGEFSEELKTSISKHLPTFTHFLDLPIVFVIIFIAVTRPTDWNTFFVGLPLAIAVSLLFSWYIPKKYPWKK